MIGVFKPGRIAQADAKQLYKSVYCSLCYELRVKYGLFYSLFISHEVIHLLIANLRYTSTSVCFVRCVNCFKSKQQAVSNSSLSKAADCCLLLVWLKFVDARKDNEHFIYRCFINLFTPQVKTIIPRLSPQLQTKAHEYVAAIDEGAAYPQMIELTAKLAASIFCEIIEESQIEPEVREELLSIGEGYGRIIALTDPIVDYEKDVRKKKENPIVQSFMNEYINQLNAAINKTELLIRKLGESGKTTKYLYTFFALSVRRIRCGISKCTPD